jgi:hypothetical protein
MDDNRKKALAAALGQIEKQFGKGSVMRLGDNPMSRDVDVVSTGSIGLDIALGVGGVPRGRVVEIYGPEASGKTTLTLQIVAEAQKAGGTAAFVDAEHALDPSYAEKLGVNVDELLVSQPDTGEQALEITDMLVRSGAVDVIIVDSVAALTPKAEIEGEMGDSHMGLQARLMSQALRKLTGNIKRSSDAEIAEGDTVVSLATAVRDDHRHASIRALVDDWNSKQEEFLRNPDMYGAMEAELKVILSEHSASSSLLTRLTDVNQDLWTEYVHMHKKIAVGFPLPFPFLQQVLNGLKTEEMTTVVARTSVGKSWVALLQAIHAVNFLENPPEILKSAWGEDGFESRFGETVLFVSFEMSAKRVYSRLACILAEVQYGAVRRGQLTKEEMIKYKHFLSHCKDGAFAKRFLVLPPSAVTDPVKLVASARDVNARLIIADSMDRMNGPRYKGMKDEPRLGSIWEEAQLLSIDPAWRHHIFCTTQLNRDAAGGRSVGADKVAGADRIGRATDNLIFLLQSRQQKRRRQVSITADKARDAATSRKMASSFL